MITLNLRIRPEVYEELAAKKRAGGSREFDAFSSRLHALTNALLGEPNTRTELHVYAPVMSSGGTCAHLEVVIPDSLTWRALEPESIEVLGREFLRFLANSTYLEGVGVNSVSVGLQTQNKLWGDRDLEYQVKNSLVNGTALPRTAQMAAFAAIFLVRPTFRHNSSGSLVVTAAVELPHTLNLRVQVCPRGIPWRQMAGLTAVLTPATETEPEIARALFNTNAEACFLLNTAGLDLTKPYRILVE